ncbi:5-methylcytosine-specific restriction enzyme subunit McrC [compost metagenome]
MTTDVILENLDLGQRMVIDTKFTSIYTRSNYREQTLRSGYLYQIYAYLRSQVDDSDTLARLASGLLLHPSIGETVDESVVIQGHYIRFATVDLAASSREIRDQLMRMIKPDPRCTS